MSLQLEGWLYPRRMGQCRTSEALSSSHSLEMVIQLSSQFSRCSRLMLRCERPRMWQAKRSDSWQRYRGPCCLEIASSMIRMSRARSSRRSRRSQIVVLIPCIRSRFFYNRRWKYVTFVTDVLNQVKIPIDI